MPSVIAKEDAALMRKALALARRAYGDVAPNPLVGAFLVKKGIVIGQGWHHRAGMPHAEIEAFRNAIHRGNDPREATLYVTLEPCSTHGRTPPCTDAIIAAGVRRVVVAATDPNPAHRGKGLSLLRDAGIDVVSGIMEGESTSLNESFNHWIVHKTPFVTVKAAMTLDGKIATASGESKWITGEEARADGMMLRKAADAIVVGVGTILADDPALTVRNVTSGEVDSSRRRRRIVLDTFARTPLKARVIADAFKSWTTIVCGKSAPQGRVKSLARQVDVIVAPERTGMINLQWLLTRLGKEEVTSVLVEGGGEVNASFLLGGFAHRVAFYYAPMVLGGSAAKSGVGGKGIGKLSEMLKLEEVRWRNLGVDLALTARVARKQT